ncbi:ATP-binding cassette domain-containing protein [Cellulosimicrobium sp. NPDC057862]|uniref:ATP-binding cassette domain-containing protein n=1 Tax=Cellulosimicrobium sp. NPDC057862 TaxID=3346266 RepID=UPI00367090B9
MTWGVRGLDVVFRTGHGHVVRALAGVDLDLPRGQVTSVVGGDGAGKTTLARALLGQVPVAGGVVDAPTRDRVGYQPSSSGVWPALTVAENVELVGDAYRMPAARRERRADELLERAGLAEARDRLGSQLSGGMRQKLGVCLAMLHEPDVLLLDEPSTGVDPVSRVELWRLVAESAASGAAVLVTTTYLDEAERAADVVVLDAGTVLAAGTPDDVRAAAPGRITVATVPPAGEDGRTWRRGPTFHTWWPDGAPTPSAGTVDVDLEDAVVALTLGSGTHGTHGTDDADGDGVSPATPRAGRPTGGAASQDAPLVRVEGAERRFGDVVAVGGVSLVVQPGEVVGLLGANGAGKTTLLRMILGLDRLDGGRVDVLGAPPDRAGRRSVGYVPQGLGLSGDLSVEENVEFVAAVYGVRDVPALPPALAAVRRRPVAEIGLGRRRQLAFHCALLHAPRLLVLDEPTSGVDPLARARAWDAIHGQADAGVGVLVTTHYLQEAEQCDRLHVLSRGRSVASGTVADVVGGREAVVVRSRDWQAAFAALDAAGLPVMLDGRAARVAGTPPATVRDALAAAGVTATCDVVPATLEETMVLVDRASATPAGAA